MIFARVKAWSATLGKWIGMQLDPNNAMYTNPGPLAYGTDTAGVAQRDDLRNNWEADAIVGTPASEAIGSGEYAVIEGFTFTNGATASTFDVTLAGTSAVKPITPAPDSGGVFKFPHPIEGGDGEDAGLTITDGTGTATLFGYKI